LAAAIEGALGVESDLEPGDAGVFDVDADGERVFSKHEAGRFPDHAEVLDALRARRG